MPTMAQADQVAQHQRQRPAAAPAAPARRLYHRHRLPRTPCVMALATSCGDQKATPRRALLQQLAGGIVCIAATAATGAPTLVLPSPAMARDAADVERMAFEAYANREFDTALELVGQLLQQSTEPEDQGRLFEMRAQVLVDSKRFKEAIEGFDAALRLTPPSQLTTRARLLAGQALAREGLGDWRGALGDYDQALDLAFQGGESADPYVYNAMGNCYNSLGQWAEARDNYLLSSRIFQEAKGFRGAGGSTTQRLDGAIFAASNAALMLAQMGDEDGAMKEMERIARRAPGSVDMRAALAALLWAHGKPEAAEAQWQFACEAITTGCSKYRDADWLSRVRRWPPRMVDRMDGFLTLKQG